MKRPYEDKENTPDWRENSKCMGKSIEEKEQLKKDACKIDYSVFPNARDVPNKRRGVFDERLGITRENERII